MKVVLFSYHYLQSRLNAGFHHLARAYHELGCDVVFVTAPVSFLSVLGRDSRLVYPLLREANRRKEVDDRLTSYVWFTIIHPANLRHPLANKISGPFFLRLYRRARLGSLKSTLTSADLIVFESTPAIALAPVVRRFATDARLAYRVSDDLEILQVHPAVVEAEREALPLFDYVSAPNLYSVEKLGIIRDVVYQQHAIDKDLFDVQTPSPYNREMNAVWVGRAQLDYRAIEAAAAGVPDMTFHIIGPQARSFMRENVVCHGELPFEQTIPFLQHADVGLALYAGERGRIPPYWADSMKVVQYSYCGLPIVAPSALRSGRPHMFFYEPGSAESVAPAIRAALAAGNRTNLSAAVPTWSDVANALAGR